MLGKVKNILGKQIDYLKRLHIRQSKHRMELAKEKGAYPAFEGSEWQTGEYFERRGYTSARWLKLKEEV